MPTNMIEPRTPVFQLFPQPGRRLFSILLLVFFSVFSARAMIQFDVFPGFDDLVPEASWFPIVCEVKNDGPSFTGVIEVTGGQFNESQVRRVMVELPTGTLKRIVIPVFSTARYQSSWDVRLLDERGRTRAEQLNRRPRREINSGMTLMGAVPRTATGMPVMRAPQSQNTELQPASARIPTTLFPDNPLVFEGLDSIYLNSEKAADLNDQQVFALLAWLNNGGHLIVGIEQITDVNAVPWLKNIVPCDLTDMHTVSAHHELQDWLRGKPSAADDSPKTKRPRFPVRNRFSNYNPFSDLAEDPDFEKADLQVLVGSLRNGDALVSAGDTPLMIASHQGRGRVTALMFSPERKPFSTWKNLPSFWAKLAEVSPEIYRPENANNNFNPNMNGSASIDGVFGAMIDSKQVRKLPVEWLLLLLIVYLVVIGPLDQYWLKRIKRPMLTWVTFPCYVVMFSFLIYFIGYKLRAGETEWNELHLVDVLQAGDGAELRGHTYASIYSPINATYRVESEERFSAFRGEFQSWNGGGQGGERAEILQVGDNFKADIFVPVWTSQLYASDWLQAAPMPVKFDVTSDAAGWSVTVMNMREHSLTNAHLVVAGRIMELGELPSQQTKTFKFAKEQGRSVRDFVGSIASGFQTAANGRQFAFGASSGGHIGDLPNSTIAASFISSMDGDRFITPPGLDLSSVMEHGNAILLAWESGYSPIKPLNQFSARRGRTDTLWRLSVPVNAVP
jgi:hypothetical protein